MKNEQNNEEPTILDLNNSQIEASDYNGTSIGMDTLRAKKSQTPGLTTRRTISQFQNPRFEPSILF
jgi:hypothetical protein